MTTKIQSDFYAQWKGDIIKATITGPIVIKSLDSENIEIVELDSSGGAFTATLPDITLLETGKRIWVYDNGSASTNNITIIANTGDGSAIDDGDEYVVNQNNRVVKFELINDRWMVLESVVKQRVLGAFSFQENTIGTVISDPDTFTDIEGVGIVGELTSNFNFTTPPNVLENIFAVEYIGVLTFSASITKVLGAASRDISVVISVDTGSGFTVVARTTTDLTITDGISHTSLTAFFKINNGDKFKAMVKGKDSTDDILVVDALFGMVRLT